MKKEARQIKLKPKRSVKRKIFILFVCLIVTYLAGFIGSIFTTPIVKSDWYNSIKPAITPPGEVIGLVWNILFLLIAISIYFAWINSKDNQDKKKIISLFTVNLILNTLWSFLFFGLKNPLVGFIDLIFIWFSILVLIIAMWRISRTSSYLLIPYFLWVGFAGIINYLAIH